MIATLYVVCSFALNGLYPPGYPVLCGPPEPYAEAVADARLYPAHTIPAVGSEPPARISAARVYRYGHFIAFRRRCDDVWRAEVYCPLGDPTPKTGYICR